MKRHGTPDTSLWRAEGSDPEGVSKFRFRRVVTLHFDAPRGLTPIAPRARPWPPWPRVVRRTPARAGDERRGRLARRSPVGRAWPGGGDGPSRASRRPADPRTR